MRRETVSEGLTSEHYLQGKVEVENRTNDTVS